MDAHHLLISILIQSVWRMFLQKVLTTQRSHGYVLQVKIFVMKMKMFMINM